MAHVSLKDFEVSHWDSQYALSRWCILGFTIFGLDFILFQSNMHLGFMSFDAILNKHEVLFQNQLTMGGVGHVYFKDCEISYIFDVGSSSIYSKQGNWWCSWEWSWFNQWRMYISKLKLDAIYNLYWKEDCTRLSYSTLLLFWSFLIYASIQCAIFVLCTTLF